jgi:DNA-binding response OmpR family regulator
VNSRAAAAARKRAGMRVLLIEDDRTAAQSIELMLNFESFNVYTTDVGEEGIDLGKLYDYDIILLACGQNIGLRLLSLRSRI